MKILPEEAAVGIETFFTETPGIKGTLRAIPEDFQVCEQASPIPEEENGSHTIATVTAKNWETNHLIRELANRLHISKKRIHFAGTKDKRAVSTQQMSFYQVPKERLEQVVLKDVSIENLFSAAKRLHVGDLIGNTFCIVVRDVSQNVSKQTLDSLLQPMKQINGFPNFFGIQRFGIIRPITHLIGKYIFQANFEQAVMTYLTFCSEKEQKDITLKRKELLETHDFKNAFHSFPNTLGFEKILLQHLISSPQDFIGALEKLPQNLLTMFTYAYQSYIFNRIISKRIQKKLPLHQAIEGDVILPIRNNNIVDESVPVTTQNIKKVNFQLAKGRGVVSSILPGSNTTVAYGTMGEIEQQIIEEEDIDLRDFIIPELPVASSYGTRRAILAAADNLNFSLSSDDFHQSKQAVTLHFSLRKGCYATSLLREIMKASDIRAY